MQYTDDKMGGPERDRNKQGSVPPALTAELARWARAQVVIESGCLLRVGWSDTGQGWPVAAVAGVEAHPSCPNARPDVAQRAGRRLCSLLSATLPAVSQLTARGVPARDVLWVLWRLERTRRDPPKPSRKRQAEAKALEQAAVIVERYRPLLEHHTPWLRVERAGDGARWRLGHPFYPDGAWLAWVAENLLGMPSQPAGARPEWHVLAAARAIEILVRRAGGKAVAREISAAVRAAWPNDAQWPGADRERAARKLLARARQRVTDEQLERLLGLLSDKDKVEAPDPLGPGLGGNAALLAEFRAGTVPTDRAIAERARNVPANVPAATKNRPHSSPRQPRAKKKTPR